MQEEQNHLQVTSALLFRDKRREREMPQLVELPSGNVFKISRPDVVKLIREGIIPADLAIAAQAAAPENGGKIKLDGKMFQDYLKMRDLITVASVVEPKVKDRDVTDEEYNQGIISVYDIDADDKEFISVYVNTGDTDLEQFRSKQEG
nr:MAG TPA: hypothetical protein [Caudoviricetes sp.]